MLFCNSISCTPSYLQASIPWKLKKCMAKFSVGDHKLKIETGRHYRPNIPLQEKTCTICDMNSVKGELHFLIIRPTYKHLRDKLFSYDADRPTISDPISDPIISLLNNNDTTNIRNIATYIEEALAYRDDLNNLL